MLAGTVAVQPSRQRGDGAGDESRTRDLNLGKVALYQLSYSRISMPNFWCPGEDSNLHAVKR